MATYRRLLDNPQYQAALARRRSLSPLAVPDEEGLAEAGAVDEFRKMEASKAAGSQVGLGKRSLALGEQRLGFAKSSFDRQMAFDKDVLSAAGRANKIATGIGVAGLGVDIGRTVYQQRRAGKVTDYLNQQAAALNKMGAHQDAAQIELLKILLGE